MGDFDYIKQNRYLCTYHIILRTMETVKISERGQVTIPYAIRARMNLKGGDTVAFVEEGEKVYVLNTALPAMQAIQQKMKGKGESVGFNTPDDVAAYIRSMREQTSNSE
jgi:AbrB family looped-hinge helix DNA binding protein